MSIEIEKVRNIAIYLSQKVPNLYLTKFLKLLYYLDFISVQETGSSVTNDTYFALPYGPIPSFIKDNLNLLDKSSRDNEVELLKSPNDKSINNNKSILDGYVKLDKRPLGTIIKSSKNFDSTKLSEYEKNLLDDIIKEFEKVPVKDIVEKTHKEAPYIQTSPSNIIDYGMAFQLNIKEILPQRTFLFDKEISLSRFNTV